MRQIIVDFGTLHIFGLSIPLHVYGYGLMIVLGFLTAIALATWRTRRAGEDPDAMVHIGLWALLSGVVGARIGYVIQHWQEQFAHAPNRLAAVLDITSGGLIYYGGVILATVVVLAYMLSKRIPMRRYLDLVTPSLMLGLAFGRMGCLLNGCCYGSVCSPQWALGMQFPMFSQPLVKLDGRDSPFSAAMDGPSPVYQQQLGRADRYRAIPDPHLVNRRLLTRSDRGAPAGHPPLPPRDLHGKLATDQLGVMTLAAPDAQTAFDALAGADSQLSHQEWLAAVKPGHGQGLLGGCEHWSEALTFDTIPDGRLDFDEMWNYQQWRRDWLLQRFDADGDGSLVAAERAAAGDYLQADEIALAQNTFAHPVKPAQALGIANALLICALLLLLHRLRRREGQVFAAMVILYPITRFVLEAIRDDNPHNLLKGILTHNQWTSLAMIAGGIALLVVLRFLPASAGPTWAQRIAGTTEHNNR